MYHYMWWVISYGDPLKAASTILFTPFFVEFAFYVVFQALAVYFNLYYLIPKFLEKGRLQQYLVFSLITTFVAALCIIPAYYLIPYIGHQNPYKIYGSAGLCFFYFMSRALPSTFASMTLAMTIKLAKHWMHTKNKQQLLEKEKLETELRFLKNQFNPHFLFNSINAIFFLIHKNPDVASASLAKFSELLRHQLYECNDHRIGLHKEINYLENFIGLEKLRQNKHTIVTVHIDAPHTSHLCIAPFILMTFLENAFKHASGWINIQLSLQDEQLFFEVSNGYTPEANNEAIPYSGIGLQNVQRRLDLMYPGAHLLEIIAGEDRFLVKLVLKLEIYQMVSVA